MLNSHETAKPVSAAELRSLADYLPDNAANHLLALAERQAKAESEAHSQQAQSFLALIDGLSEYDRVAASHLLVGLLRIAAGQKLLSVEQTALRIAGLAEIDQNALLMTAEGQSLLAIISPTGPAKVAAAACTEGDACKADANGVCVCQSDDAAADTTPHVPVAFANIRFGQRLFEVADGKKPGSLTFRLVGDENWKPLENDRSCGWDEIGGEILEKGIDLTDEYVMMHTMRLAVPEQGEGVHHFELAPLNWWIRITGETASLRVDGSADWLPVPDDIKEPTVRALGIQAAERLIPNFRDLLHPEAIIWSRRMAHAAAVTPIMSSAA